MLGLRRLAQTRVEFVQLLGEIGPAESLLRRINRVVCEYPVETAFGVWAAGNHGARQSICRNGGGHWQQVRSADRTGA